VFDGGGWWVIFPIIGLIFMLLMMSRMFGFGRRGSGKGRGMGPMGMGPMGMMGHDHEPDSEGDESALEVLRKRYAAGELTDEEFDAKRRRLEGR
jgi:putative membrane protein